jgi:type II secretory ATPase GspE/PulE/Tfp pilus assembly ATPase PilB-like protein
MAIFPEDQSYAHRAVTYLKVDNKVQVASDHPQAEKLKAYLVEMGKTAKLTFSVSYCSKTSIEYALSLYRVLNPKIVEKEVAVTEEVEDKFEKEIKSMQELKDKISKVSTTELLDVIFAGAVKLDASDIHIEPGEENLRIRYRIDGVLQDVTELPMDAFHNLMSRLKYMAKLKLDITHPQDGRFAVKVMSQDIDIRVATLPTSYGEAVTMRLLPKNRDFISLDKLGFSEKALAAIKNAMAMPQGMIINTGPTGSGKTTTLYAILKELNQPGKKIITIEDPIEYRIEGIEQVQVVHEQKNIGRMEDNAEKIAEKEQTSFLDALKGCLRQDPDILMVGEIRDKETADIALQASLTGHLVLTTLHTTNAPAALARLADMGVEPYLLAGTINLIIAQRLVRKIHTECGGKGCTLCHNTGFKGRVAIIEVLKPGAEIEKLILEKAPLRSFEETAHKLGMETMHEDGLNKVKQGITIQEEVDRVTRDE